MNKLEREARIDLAAALRWASRLGLGEGICNHFSLAVPGRDSHFLINPQGFHWSEVRPADLVVVDAAGRKIAGAHNVEPPRFSFTARCTAEAVIRIASCIRTCPLRPRSR